MRLALAGTAGPSGGLGYGALRDKTLGGEPPQRDEQLPGERDDEHLAHAPARLPEPLPEPCGEAATGLVAEPEPGKLDHRCSQPTITGLRDILFPLNAAAGEGRADQAGVGSECFG